MVTKLLVYKILQLFVMMILGFLITKFKVIRSEDSVVLSKISLYLLMPSAIISAFDFERDGGVLNSLLFAFLAAIVVHIILLLLDLLYARFITRSPVERASVMYSNAGNLIIPIVSFVLGSEYVIYSTAFLTVQLAFIWSHGVRLFSANEKFNIKKVLLNVNIISIALGVILMLSGLRLPSFARDVVSPLGDMLGPVSMLIAGMLAGTLTPSKLFSKKEIYRIVLMRMIAYPLVILGVLKLLSLLPVVNADKILLISFLAGITPSASTVMQFSQIHNQDSELATGVNILTTVVSILTMPIFVTVFGLF